MVIHSPYDPWDRDNLDNGPKDREKRVSAILDTLGPALTRAEDLGVEMVMENIKDTDPGDRMAVIEAADSAALRLSVDTGHAHWAHTICGAPPADRFISHAGAMLGHVHLQDTDGWADRHWPLGEGNIVWPAVFKALAGCDAHPHLIVEINDFDRVEASVAHLASLGLAQ
jgi:sugar phosphate isomerase/epimerase